MPGKPLTHRRGFRVARQSHRQYPATIIARSGMSVQELIQHCGGLNDFAAKVVMGGPMMGFAIANFIDPADQDQRRADISDQKGSYRVQI